MTVEDLRDEIIRLKNDLIEAPNKSDIDLGRISAFEDMLLYIDHPEETTDEDLEESAEESGQKYFPDANNIWARPNYEAVYAGLAFKDGANWQKRQMMKGAVDADVNTYECVGESSYVEFVANLPVSQFRKDDKVKLIIVKEAEK